MKQFADCCAHRLLICSFLQLPCKRDVFRLKIYECFVKAQIVKNRDAN